MRSQLAEMERLKRELLQELKDKQTIIDII